MNEEKAQLINDTASKEIGRLFLRNCELLAEIELLKKEIQQLREKSKE